MPESGMKRTEARIMAIINLCNVRWRISSLLNISLTPQRRTWRNITTPRDRQYVVPC